MGWIPSGADSGWSFLQSCHSSCMFLGLWQKWLSLRLPSRVASFSLISTDTHTHTHTHTHTKLYSCKLFFLIVPSSLTIQVYHQTHFPLAREIVLLTSLEQICCWQIVSSPSSVNISISSSVLKVIFNVSISCSWQGFTFSSLNLLFCCPMT